jgi:hypothetical protein
MYLVSFKIGVRLSAPTKPLWYLKTIEEFVVERREQKTLEAMNLIGSRRAGMAEWLMRRP